MILVTGATGNVGGELVRQLVAAQQPVRALVRKVDAGAWPSGVEPVLGDLAQPESLSGALTHQRAVPFRAVCESWAEDPAVIAHRYALAMDGVDTLILGVKNRRELDQALAAEAAGPLEPDRIAEIDGLRLRE